MQGLENLKSFMKLEEQINNNIDIVIDLKRKEIANMLDEIKFLYSDFVPKAFPVEIREHFLAKYETKSKYHSCSSNDKFIYALDIDDDNKMEILYNNQRTKSYIEFHFYKRKEYASDYPWTSSTELRFYDNGELPNQFRENYWSIDKYKDFELKNCADRYNPCMKAIKILKENIDDIYLSIQNHESELIKKKTEFVDSINAENSNSNKKIVKITIETYC